MYFNDKNKTILLKGRRTIAISYISFLQAKGNYTLIHLGSGECKISTSTLKCFEDALPLDSFIRPNRSIIINKSSIESVNYQEKSIFLKSGQKIMISRRKKSKTLNDIECFLRE